MNLVWNGLSITTLVLGLTFGVSQQIHANPQDQQQEQEDDSSDQLYTPETLKMAFGPLFTSTNTSISKDITETKEKIQKITDVKVQADEVRALILRVTAKMTSYTPSDLNIYLHLAEGDPVRIPYSLVDSQKLAPGDTPWFEFMKDPKNAPEFNEPIKLIDKVAKSFAKISKVGQETTQDLLDLLNNVPKPDSTSPGPSQPPSNFDDPRLIKTKYLFKRLRQKHSST